MSGQQGEKVVICGEAERERLTFEGKGSPSRGSSQRRVERFVPEVEERISWQ